jgi:ribosomal protein L11 methyltransferase
MSAHESRFDIESLPVKNWNEEWEKNFDPVVVDDFCSIRAEFHKPNPRTRFELIITPKMSFGTGHHATTFMMLQLMQHLELKDETVLDFGTGTGILAIMAEKLGAADVVAIDIDEWSIQNAIENLALNGCRRIQLYKSDNIPADKSFKIILANINRNVILEQLPVMCKLLTGKGELLLSGLMVEDFEMIQSEAMKYRLVLHKKLERSGWIALRYIIID